MYAYKCIAGYVGSEVVGNNIKTIPPIIPPVAKKTSPTLFSFSLVNELKKPAYNNKLQ